MSLKNNSIKDFGQLKISDVMIQDPLYYTTPDQKISATELYMLRKNIGGLPVIKETNNKKVLLGIITQRDIRLARFAMSLDSPNTTVKDLMTSDPVIAHISDTVENVLSKMFENNVERIPIIDEENSLIGLVLIKDILKKLQEFL